MKGKFGNHFDLYFFRVHNGCVNRILGIMEDHYTKMKDQLGLPEMQKALKNE
jgi:membrane-anchored protein YejM (alkaline phosphatase superfamily)